MNECVHVNFCNLIKQCTFFFTFFSLNQETTLIVVEKLGNIREFYCEIVLIAIKLFF